jgi:hypothetical protein
MNSKSLNQVLLAFNLALVAAVIFLVSRDPHPPLKLAEIPSVAPNETLPVVSAPKPRPYAAVIGESDWRHWVDTLREAGVPTRVLARLVREGFDDQWQTRQADAQAAYMRGDMDVDGLGALSIEHDFEQEKAIRTALGEEDFRKWNLTNVLQSLNLRDIQLTPAETDALYDLQKKHLDRGNELLAAKLKGQIDYATMEEQQARAEADYNAKLKALLGEQRYGALQGSDEGAGELQRSLTEAKLPADVPFESLLGLQNQWTERRSEMAGQVNEAKSQISNWEQEIKRIDDQRDQEFQRVLGTNAFDTLTAAQDSRYKEMKRYADNWGIGDAEVDFVYRTIKYYEKNVADYNERARKLEAGGQSVDWDAMKQNIQQFDAQIEQSVRSYLGDARFDKLKQNRILQFGSLN